MLKRKRMRRRFMALDITAFQTVKFSRREVLQKESCVSCGNRGDSPEAEEGSCGNGGEEDKCRVHGMAVAEGSVGDVVDNGEKKRDDKHGNGETVAANKEENESG